MLRFFLSFDLANNIYPNSMARKIIKKNVFGSLIIVIK